MEVKHKKFNLEGDLELSYHTAVDSVAKQGYTVPISGHILFIQERKDFHEVLDLPSILGTHRFFATMVQLTEHYLVIEGTTIVDGTRVLVLVSRRGKGEDRRIFYLNTKRRSQSSHIQEVNAKLLYLTEKNEYMDLDKDLNYKKDSSIDISSFICRLDLDESFSSSNGRMIGKIHTEEVNASLWRQLRPERVIYDGWQAFVYLDKDPNFQDIDDEVEYDDFGSLKVVHPATNAVRSLKLPSVLGHCRVPFISQDGAIMALEPWHGGQLRLTEILTGTPVQNGALPYGGIVLETPPQGSGHESLYYWLALISVTRTREQPVMPGEQINRSLRFAFFRFPRDGSGKSDRFATGFMAGHYAELKRPKALRCVSEDILAVEFDICAVNKTLLVFAELQEGEQQARYSFLSSLSANK